MDTFWGPDPEEDGKGYTPANDGGSKKSGGCPLLALTFISNMVLKFWK